MNVLENSRELPEICTFGTMPIFLYIYYLLQESFPLKKDPLNFSIAEKNIPRIQKVKTIIFPTFKNYTIDTILGRSYFRKRFK